MSVQFLGSDLGTSEPLDFEATDTESSTFNMVWSLLYGGLFFGAFFLGMAFCWRRSIKGRERKAQERKLQGTLPQGRIRREGAPEAVRQAVGGGCQSGWGRLLSVPNAIEAGVWRQGDSGWA